MSGLDVRVKVRLFAGLREAMSRDQLDLELPDDATPEDAWLQLAAGREDLAPRRRSLAVAINRRYARFDERLSDGDELAFIPPVSGG